MNRAFRAGWACLAMVFCWGCGGAESDGPSSFTAAQVRAEVHPGDVAMDPAGRFFVVWGDDREGAPRLRARLYGADGRPLTDEMLVSSDDRVTGYASVRMNAQGESIVAFNAEAGWGEYDSRVRRFDAAGKPIGPDLIVFRNSVRPDVEFLPDGGFVVADTVHVTGGESYEEGHRELKLRRFDSQGQPQGPERTARSWPGSEVVQPFDPRIQTTPQGGYSVVWDTQFQQLRHPVFGFVSLGAFAMRFTAQDQEEFLSFLLLDPPAGMQELRSQQNHFVNLPDGRIALLVQGLGVQAGDGAQRLASLQLLSATGAPQGEAFQLSTDSQDADIVPQDLAMFACEAPSGCLLIATWLRIPRDRRGDATVFTRIFDAQGRPLFSPLSATGAEFPLGNVREYGAYPYVSGNARGDLVLVWRKTGHTKNPQIEEIEGLHYPHFADEVLPASTP